LHLHIAGGPHVRRFTQANFFSCQFAAVHETVAALPVYFEAERLSSCQIDDELELGRLCITGRSDGLAPLRMRPV